MLVIDDHPLVFEGCRQLLKDAGAAGISHAQSLAAGFRLYRQNRPNLILMDLAIGRRALAGLSFVRRLRLFDSHTPILVFSMHDDPLIASEALKIGANGYVVKDAPCEEIVKAVLRVREGMPYLSHDLASAVAFMEARRRTTNPIQSITQRELRILSQIAEGKSYGQIAANLLVSYKTVANTYSRLKAKLGARSTPELMQIAMQHLPSTPDGKLHPATSVTAPDSEARGARRHARVSGK